MSPNAARELMPCDVLRSLYVLPLDVEEHVEYWYPSPTSPVFLALPGVRRRLGSRLAAEDDRGKRLRRSLEQGVQHLAPRRGAQLRRPPLDNDNM